MKTRTTILSTLLLLLFTASSSLAAIRYVDPAAGADGGTCLTSAAPCATIAWALSVADQGDTIQLFPGTYAEGEITISLDFITIQGPTAALIAAETLGTTPTFEVDPALRTAGDGNEAIIDLTGFDYAFGIAADNVTISSLDITGDPSTTWAGVRVLSGGWDRWTIEYNFIHDIGQKNPGSTLNHSYGIFGDSQTSSGTLSMTGNEIQLNHVYDLGGQALAGANTTAGMGIRLEGIEGDGGQCNALDKFDCGVWIHDNDFWNLYVGQNSNNFVFDVNGKEPSIAVAVYQDDDNSNPNNGSRINDNTYADDASGDLDFGVVVGIGDSFVEELNANFTNTSAYVVNIDRKATVDEPILADFYKSLHPDLLGPGSDVYFSTLTLAQNNSDDTATIVFVDATGGLLTITVTPQGESASYKVSLDSAGDLNLRQGARLLFDGALSDGLGGDGVTNLILAGTSGNDLLTVDFNNGNPTPLVSPGIDFDGGDGFDAITLRGDEQLTWQTIVMDDSDGGTIMFEPGATALSLARQDFTPGTTSDILFDNLEPIDDVLIVNATYAVVAQDDENHEINVIGGPFRYGFDTFQINSGQDATFEEINYANKKTVRIFGADDTGSGDGQDVFTVFTPDGDAPDLMLALYLYGGDTAGGAPDPDDASDDYFVVRPSADFPIYVYGGDEDNADWLFLDCANTDVSCQPGLLAGIPVDGDTGGAITGFEDVTWEMIESTAGDLLADDLEIRKELIGFAVDGAHPGDDLEYRVTVRNTSGVPVDLTTATGTPLWVTDVVDHRLSLIEQSIVTEAGSVDFTGNRNMLWNIDDINLADGDSVSMTYTVIVNTLITTDDIHNYASILNQDANVNQYADNGGDTLEHFGHVDLDVLEVFGFPLKAAIQASLFYETEAGPRYMVGLYAGAKDPAQGNLGAMLCRVPDTNEAAGWDGGLGNLWYSCGEGLPAKDGLFSPLVVTDLYQDSSGRIWLTSWGFDGLFYSDDGGQTWTSAEVDLSGAAGGAPDGVPDGFAQIYSITEDILGTLFISANNGDIYRSFDRGQTWQKAKQLPMGSADTAYSLEADPTLPGTLYAGTFGDSLYVTSDFAETWVRPDLNDLGSGYIYDIEFDPFSGNLFVGTAQGIYYSADGGDNWDGLNNAFPEPTHPPEVRTISFDENGALFASTWGQGVWWSIDWQAAALGEFALKNANILQVNVANGFVHVLTDSGETFKFAYEGRSSSVDTEEPGQELPEAYSLDQNYPNPFNPVTTIQFTLPQAGDVNLSVYDVLGRRVATLINGSISSGIHSVNFNASNLPSGMYLYRLTTPAGQLTQKMILLK